MTDVPPDMPPAEDDVLDGCDLPFDQDVVDADTEEFLPLFPVGVATDVWDGVEFVKVGVDDGA